MASVDLPSMAATPDEGVALLEARGVDRLGDATRWRRRVSALACSAVLVGLAVSGTLEPGRLRSAATPLGLSRADREILRGVLDARDPLAAPSEGDAVDSGAHVAALGRSGARRRSDRGDRRSRASRRDARDADRPPPRASRSKAPPPFADAAPWTHPDPARAAKYSRLVKRSALGADADAPGLVDASVGGLGLSRRSRDPPGRDLPAPWTAPLRFITLGAPKETKAMSAALRTLAATFGGDAVRENVRAVPGVDVLRWPRDVDFAEYAVSGVLAHTQHPEDPARALGELPWVNALVRRDPRSGRMTDEESLRLSHHFGCLFAHVAQWQMSLDEGAEHTFVFESDGFEPGLLGVPVSALGAIQRAAPRDYDLVFLHHPGEVVGDLLETFADPLGNDVELYAFENPVTPSGLSGYMFSDRFVAKILPLIASRGADMVDAWLMGHLCRPLRENDWAYDLPHYEGANDGKGVQWGEKFLNCYKAMTKGARLPGR